MFTFTIKKVQGEITARMFDSPSTAEHGSAWVGDAKWSKLTVNGVDYPEGSAYIKYHHREGFTIDLSLHGGIWGRSEFTDAAKKLVKEGILEALRGENMLVLPHIHAINAGALASTRYAGNFEGENIKGSGRKIREYAQIVAAITGHSAKSQYVEIPAAPGALTEKDIRREYLEAARKAIEKELEKLA